MRIGTKVFDTENEIYVMAILNVTPDSFYDGGKNFAYDDAMKRVENMLAEGADIIDVGGESTRPGYVMISDDEEIERICPVIEGIKKNFDVVISADTYKSRVAKEALISGADMINDIWGLKWDENMAGIVAGYDSAICITHNRKEAVYNDFINDMMKDLHESIDMALKAGIKEDKIMVDPGVGFAKSYEQNISCIKELDRLKEMGYPVLLAASSKSVIGLTLDLPVDQRLEGTLVTTVAAVNKGASFVRVHHVKENKRAIRMALALR